MVEKYVEIKSLSELQPGESVSAYYPGNERKNTEHITREVMKDVCDGKAKLLVWRSVDDNSEMKKTLEHEELRLLFKLIDECIIHGGISYGEYFTNTWDVHATLEQLMGMMGLGDYRIIWDDANAFPYPIDMEGNLISVDMEIRNKYRYSVVPFFRKENE